MTANSSETSRPKICVVSTTQLIVHFFLQDHLEELSRIADVILALNPDNDSYVPELNLPVRKVAIGIKRPISPFADLKALWQLYRLFRSEMPDLVWPVAPKAGLLAMLAARLAGVPTRFFVFQGEVWASRKGAMRFVLKLADRITASLATHLLAVSASEKAFLEAQGVVRKGRLGVLGMGSISGVDLVRYKADAVARQQVRVDLGIPLEATVALFVGRLNEDKGIYLLANAFRELAESNPSIWLLLVGPDEENAYPRIVGSLGAAAEKCRIVGFTSEPERYMAASDFICLPSQREGFGMVIIEAAAAGIPSVGSRIYGISDAIREGETGLLVEPKCAVALKAAMQRLANDDQLRRAMGSAARRYVEMNFSSQEVVRRYVECIASCLPGSVRG